MTESHGLAPLQAGPPRRGEPEELVYSGPVNDPNSPEMTSMIKTMLLDQRREERQGRLPELTPQGALSPGEPSGDQPRKVSLTQLVPRVPIAQRIAEKYQEMHAKFAAVASAVRARIGAGGVTDTQEDHAEDTERPPLLYQAKTMLGRVRTKHVVWTGLAIFVVLRPWFFPIVGFLLFVIVGLSYLTVGHERFCEIITGLWARFARRFPNRAENAKQKYIVFSVRHNARIERLPEAWADRFELPDLERRAQEENRADPFERLAGRASDL